MGSEGSEGSNLPALLAKIDPARLQELEDGLTERLNRLEPHTRRAYNRGVDQFAQYLGLGETPEKVLDALEALGPRKGNLLVEGYLEHLLHGPEPYARATVEVRLAALKWAMREAYAAGEISWDLRARMPRPKKDKDGRLMETSGRDMKGPTPAEAADMFRAAKAPAVKLLFCLMRYEGFRIHEIRQVNYEDLVFTDNGGGRIDVRVTMVRKKREGPSDYQLCTVTKKALHDFLKKRGFEEGPLFPGRKEGTRLSTSAIRKNIKKLAEVAGVPHMSPHRIRHRACTDIVRYCVKHGIPEEEILRLTGHSSRAALLPYYEHDMIDRSQVIVDGVADMYDEDGNLVNP